MTAHVHLFPGRRAASRAPRPERRAAALELNETQRAWMLDHGFGPDAPAHDFRDPAVRAELVQALRDCGALPAAADVPPSVAPRRFRRAG